MTCYLSILLAVAIASLSLVTTVLANGAPIKIPLTKISGITNYGSQQALGEVQITVVEGDVVLTVQGLDRLTNELYQGWLVNTKSAERISVSKFNVTADGAAKVQSVITIGNREFDLFVITVEPEPDPSANPDSRIVLAGYWPAKDPAVNATATSVAQGTPAVIVTPLPAGATPPPDASGATPRPPTGLPRTGGIGIEFLVAGMTVLGTGLSLVSRSRKT